MRRFLIILFFGVGLIQTELAYAQLEDRYTGEEIPGDFNYDLIGDRLSCLQEGVPLSNSTRVHAFVNYFVTKNRGYTREMIRRAPYFFPIFERKLAEYGLPDELKYLSIIESGLNPKAISRVGAGGLWQFMPATGRSYKLHQDWYIDERFDPEKSTDAAARYLKMLYNMFGDWELALAAYNSGPGNVRKAIRKSGYKKTFNEIYRYLPRETRSYVPQFVAIVYAMNYADEHNLHVDEHIYQIPSDTIMVRGFVNLQLLSDGMQLCYDDLKTLNPSLKRYGLLSSSKLCPIKLPEDHMAFYQEHKDSLLTLAGSTGQKELAYQARNTSGSTYGRDRVVYKVRSGDVLGSIAQRYKVRVSDIKKWNKLSSNMIRVGQRLNIWIYPRTQSTTTAQITPAVNTTIIDMSGRKVYVVQPGDTLWDIARKDSDLDIDKIKQLNNLKSSNIKPGQKLIVG